jgi:hypothetical protein
MLEKRRWRTEVGGQEYLIKFQSLTGYISMYQVGDGICGEGLI